MSNKHSDFLRQLYSLKKEPGPLSWGNTKKSHNEAINQSLRLFANQFKSELSEQDFIKYSSIGLKNK